MGSGFSPLKIRKTEQAFRGLRAHLKMAPAWGEWSARLTTVLCAVLM
jgi:hypothetical protein